MCQTQWQYTCTLLVVVVTGADGSGHRSGPVMWCVLCRDDCGEEVGALHIQRPSTSGHSGTYLACGTADLECVGQPWPFGD